MDLLECSEADPWGHWYYQVKSDALARELERYRIVPTSIVDVGAGSGFFSEFLLSRYPDATAVCVDPNYTEDDLTRSDHRLRFALQSDNVQADLYLMMDVLEHVEDDLALLREYVDDAPDGSHFYITVPAFQSLWSSHDVYLKHFRRYRLRQIEDVIDSAGLQRLHGRYLYGATFPAVAAVRRIRRNAPPESDMGQPSKLVNRLARATLSAENRLPGNRVAGSTAAVLAVKPTSSGE